MNCDCSRPTKIAATSFSRTRKTNSSLLLFGESEMAADLASSDPLSDKLSKMSFEERSNGLHDLHGVADQFVENEELIKMRTSEMTFALNSIVNSLAEEECLAFRKAVAKSPAYVENLKIRFLRADKYDGQVAARRMIRFFDQKMKYFGEEKLVKEITLDDLNEDELDALRRGVFQLLPQRDRAGRIILFVCGKLSVEYSTEAMIRAYYYILMAGLREEETQQSGIIPVYFGNGQTRIVKGRAAAYWSLWRALPLRHVGFHHCQDSSALTPSQYILGKLVESHPLCRFRFHVGSNVECIYNLMTFGIPRDVIPVRSDGSIDLTQQHQMLEDLKYREKHFIEPFKNVEKMSTSSQSSLSSLDSSKHEQLQKEDDIILVPGPMDILLGTGRQQQRRPGMIRLNSLLDEHWDSYEAASKFDKTVIAKIIHKLLKESNCRLLKPVQGGFQECDEDTARAKIAHSFRSLRRKKLKNKVVTTAGEKGENKRGRNEADFLSDL